MNLEKMDRMPAVAAVMTPFPHSIDVDAPLEQAQEMMTAHRFHHLPVMENGQVVGLVSEYRLRRALASSAPGRPDPLAGMAGAEDVRRVRDICTRDPWIVPTAAPLDAVLARMAREQILTVLVTKEGKLAGIFTFTDACHHFAAVLRQKFPGAGGDEAA